MVKKEVFEWIRTGQKTLELRRGKAMKGDVAVFQCERNILRRRQFDRCPQKRQIQEYNPFS